MATIEDIFDIEQCVPCSTTIGYRHSGEPEWNGELKDLKSKHQIDEQEIKTDIGENHITHLTMDGDCHLSLVDIAPHMTHLRLRNTSAVESLKEFTSLKKLELCHIDLSLEWPSLPSNSLEELSVIECKLETLSSCLGSLGKSLRELNISRNPIEVLPKSITTLSSLEDLNMSHCKISQLPESFGSLEVLRKLDLAGNNFREDFESITALSSLAELNLSVHHISQLPERLYELKNLKVLRITDVSAHIREFRHQGLPRLFPEVVTKLTSLEVLYMRYSKINQFPDRCFATIAYQCNSTLTRVHSLRDYEKLSIKELEGRLKETRRKQEQEIEKEQEISGKPKASGLVLAEKGLPVESLTPALQNQGSNEAITTARPRLPN
ncbi:leucine-rich repeat-containing protein 40-like [Watersipora subatra]|uniref:leucine-rich repeat-containing protein 40-like n=1 Tax=Watersipora subatra TaxID=2589382 RepID=UPI00355AF22F